MSNKIDNIIHWGILGTPLAIAFIAFISFIKEDTNARANPEEYAARTRAQCEKYENFPFRTNIVGPMAIQGCREKKR